MLCTALALASACVGSTNEQAPTAVQDQRPAFTMNISVK